MEGKAGGSHDCHGPARAGSVTGLGQGSARQASWLGPESPPEADPGGLASVNGGHPAPGSGMIGGEGSGGGRGSHEQGNGEPGGR